MCGFFFRSQSKASYLASRRERENGLPNSDIGSYKRTMSPSGQALQVQSNENLRNKEQNNIILNNNNNPTILRRASLAEKCPKKDYIKCEEPKKCNLPDVLPINAKVSSRSHVYEKEKINYSPPSSPKKSPKISPVNTLQKSYKNGASPENTIQKISVNNIQKSFPIQKSNSSDSTNRKISPSHSPNKPPSPMYINPPSPNKTESPVKLSESSNQVAPIYINSPVRNDSNTSVNKSPMFISASPVYINPPSPIKTENSLPNNITIIQAVNPLYMNPPVNRAPSYINPPSPVKTESNTSLYANSPPSPVSLEAPTKTDASSQYNSPVSETKPAPKGDDTQTKQPSDVSLYVNTSVVKRDSISSDVKPLVGRQDSEDSGFEGLQLIQRTEVTLRINTTTSDAASQTEREELATPLPTRRKFQEEIDCEKLSQDLVNYLSPSDRLKGILGKI